MTIAVTGANGYPGSHMLLCLADGGEGFVPVDEQGVLVPALQNNYELVTISLRDAEAMASLFVEKNITEVIHFAGGGFVEQSINKPLPCYQENTLTALSLMEACEQAEVARLVLSSCASVYGVPERMPINEATPLNPTSPFGSSMAMAERIVSDVAAAKGIDVAILRYFNLAGADPLGRAGEGGKPRHLIKVVAQIAVGTRQEKLQIYGDDYPTPDGTCIRDYVHVCDMADAHLAALRYLRAGGASVTLNCGYGYGASVLDVVAATGRVIGGPLATEIAPRRLGDPPLLIADNADIRTVLDWSPRYEELDLIVRTAIDWEERCKKDAA